MTTNTYRQRSTAWRLLDKLDTLSFSPSLIWLRIARWSLMLAGIGLYFTVGKIEALLLGVLLTPLEIAIVGRLLVKVLKGAAE